MPAAASSSQQQAGLVAGTAPASQQTAVAAPPAQPVQPPSQPSPAAQPSPAQPSPARPDWCTGQHRVCTPRLGCSRHTHTHTHTPHTINTLCATLATQPRVCRPEDVCAGPGLGGGGGGPSAGQPPASRQTPGRGRHSHQPGLHSSTTLTLRFINALHCN